MSTMRASSLRHVRPVQPLRFPEQEPESERMGQGRRHFNLCVALYQMLRAVCGSEHTVGADQFVYFDPVRPKRCLAPDAFVRLGLRDHDFDSYLAFENGAPELAFEVLSASDTPERWTFAQKLRRYRALGVRELVVFDVDAEAGKRLRVWDRLEHDLVERVVTDDTTPCVTLGLTLLVTPVEQYAFGLRLARDASGRDWVHTTAEALAHTVGAKEAAERAKDVAEMRVAQLEKELSAGRDRPGR